MTDKSFYEAFEREFYEAKEESPESGKDEEIADEVI